MSRFRFFSLDPGLLVTVSTTLFAAWPLLTRPGLPTFMDGEQHVYRTFEILWAWQQGVPYLRWAPNVFYGFGYPVFNYYAPLTYYLAAAYGGLCCGLALGPAAGVKFVPVLSLGLGAAGMYLFLRDRWHTSAAVVGGAAFTLSPYVFYINPVARGAAPEALSLALAPWLLWSFSRLRRTSTSQDIALAAVICAALLLAHNLMAPIFLGLLLLWLAWEHWLPEHPRSKREGAPESNEIIERKAAGERVRGALVRTALRPLRAMGLALLLGLSLAAFLWLPALLERQDVQLQEATLGLLDFRRTFVPITELLTPPATADLDLQPRVRLKFQLGVPQWVLAALGALMLLWQQEGRGGAVFFAVGAAGLTFLVTPPSLPVWEALPPLAFVQFPWRLLGPAALTAGISAGAAVHEVARRWPRTGLAVSVAALAALHLAALPLLDPLPWADFGPVSALRIIQSGQDWWPGTTATNEFLPVTVRQAPGPQPALIASYERGQIDKVDRARLPEGAQVTVLANGPEHDRFAVNSPAPFTLQVFTFAFPGWNAYLDGVRVPIHISDPEGWIRLDIPPGEHEVLLRFENTGPRWLGWGLSGLGVAGLALVVAAWRRPARPPVVVERLGLRPALAFGLVIGLSLGLRYFADQQSWWRARPPLTAERPSPEYVLNAALENNVILLGYDLPRPSARPGDPVALALYWEAHQPVTRDARVFVHVLGMDGALWAQSDHIRPGGFDSLPTGRWPLYRTTLDEHHLDLDDLPAGDYKIVAGLWDRYANQRMRVLDSDGQSTEQDSVTLVPQFKVRP
jgi:hypothetical protein